ncbi:MAG: PspC domain-containing protein [Chitinophagales bacterium]|nr:PspC domain-containing protein [Chitinophagales bacterium]
MNKTFNINLAGQIFHINDDAYEKLFTYLQSLNNIYQNEAGGDEIIRDIESRIAEIFLEDQIKIITTPQVEKVIAMLGRPEQHRNDTQDYTSENTRTYDNEPAKKKLFRDGDQKIIAGVCSGLAQYLGLNDPLWVRLFFIILVFGGIGGGFLLYIVLWIIVPEAVTASEKLQMKGAPINIDNIEKNVKDGINNVSDSFKNFDSKGTFRQISSGIIDAVIVLIKFVFQFFKAIFLFVFIAISSVLVFVLFTSGFAIFAALPALADGLFSSHFIAYSAIISLVVLFGIIILFLILLPFHVFSKNIRPFKRPVGISMGMIALLAFIITGLGVADTARQFAIKEKIQIEDTLIHDVTNKNLVITGIDNPHFFEPDINIGWMTNNWKITNNGVINQIVKINIKQSADDNIHISEEISARGKSKSDAIKNAENVIYQYQQTDNKISFNKYLESAKNPTKFRVQSVEITLYVPEGEIVNFENANELVDMQAHRKGYSYDRRSRIEDTTWIMNNGHLIPYDKSENEIL